MVGVVHVELYMPSCQSLKDKRSIVKSVLSQLRGKLNVSAAEMAYLDQWQRCEIAIAAVANEVAFLQKELAAAIRLVENAPGVELIRADTEYYD
ncbi:DUF503 domain-containing protein [Brevibacillus migulae]|uniref:DUF503 domain-containing protein n=1 Tax=Brevibacillus migulae TaxID=1644114 RepID=UPI00106EE41B|nr:DUF503 domain-containing protein [Brevibacillus migulae]